MMHTMTWGEFKRLVEAHGVTDDMEIDWIDIHGPRCDSHNHTLSISLERGGPDPHFSVTSF